MEPDPIAVRERLERARSRLLFTPEVCGDREPLDVLESVLTAIDIVQVRPKAIGARTICEARSTFDWTVRVLDLVRARGLDVLVTVDDRVDVAAALAGAGCAGVHLGENDCPVDVARSVLGPEALIGFSTHTLHQVAEAEDLPVDYLGFGPVAATTTKGLSTAVGTENAWIASQASAKPVFAIGGIDATNAQELARAGRIAVAAAILGAADPARAAAELRRLVST
jgi:thiamine-phosphate pyrophosphorylase